MISRNKVRVGEPVLGPFGGKTKKMKKDNSWLFKDKYFGILAMREGFVYKTLQKRGGVCFNRFKGYYETSLIPSWHVVDESFTFEELGGEDYLVQTSRLRKYRNAGVVERRNRSVVKDYVEYNNENNKYEDTTLFQLTDNYVIKTPRTISIWHQKWSDKKKVVHKRKPRAWFKLFRRTKHRQFINFYSASSWRLNNSQYIVKMGRRYRTKR